MHAEAQTDLHPARHVRSSLAKWAADRGFERGDGFVIIVDRVHVVTFGPLHRVLRIRHLERGARAEPVPVLRQPELIAGRLPVGRLHRDRLVGRLKPEEARVHVASHLEPPGPGVLVGVVFVAPWPGTPEASGRIR